MGLGQALSDLAAPRKQRERGWRGVSPQMRVDEVRVFYDVSGATVEVLAIVAKSEAGS